MMSNSEDKLADGMWHSARKAARTGGQRRAPKDKKKKQWYEPLTEMEFELISLMRNVKEWTAEDIAGAMDESLDDMRPRIQRLIDRQYIVVESDGRGYVRYRARRKNEIPEHTAEAERDTPSPREQLRRRNRQSQLDRGAVELGVKQKALF